jgi:hypothetical protein
MSVKKTWIGMVVGCVVLASTAFTATTKHVSAASCPGSNWDPVKTQNALTATPDPSRPWDEISGVAQGTGPSLAISNARTLKQVSFRVSLCADVPASFPTSTGDAQAEYSVCVDLPGNEPISNGPTVIGLGHRGGPIFNGPFPASQGWKVCSWAQFQTGLGANTYGTEVFDPIGQYAFADQSQLKDSSGVTSTISAPVINPVAGCKCIDLFLPETQIIHVNANVLGGPAKETDETWMATGDTVKNYVAQVQLASVGNLPFPVCVNTNPPGISCTGAQTLGPVFGVAGLLTLVDSFGANQECTSVNSNLPSAPPCSNGQSGYDLGILPIGFPAQSQPTCAGNGVGGALTCVQAVGTYNYYPCLSADSWSASLPPGQGPFPKPAPPPYYQDAGDASKVPGACGVVGNPAVSTPYEYDSEYGRTQSPFVAAVGYHLLPTFLGNGTSFVAP